VQHALGHNEHVVLPERDRRLVALAVSHGDVQPAVEDEEELVGRVVNVPDMLSFCLRDLDVVVIMWAAMRGL
jgi:hypothetical protein